MTGCFQPGSTSSESSRNQTMNFTHLAEKPQRPQPSVQKLKLPFYPESLCPQPQAHKHTQTPVTALVWLQASTFTFLVHCLTVLTSSEMTMSTHFWHGSLIFPICLFTMVSKAMSGVKSPVLPAGENGQERTTGGGEKEREKLGGKKSVNAKEILKN